MTKYIHTAQVIADDWVFAGQLAAALTGNLGDVDTFTNGLLLEKNGLPARGVDAICSISFAAAIDALNDPQADAGDARFLGAMTPEHLAYARQVINASHYQCLIDGQYFNQPDAMANLAAANGYTIGEQP